jgi:fucose permease
LSVAAAALLGFALAPVFPTLISVTPDRVGHYFAPQAVGFQVAAANIGIATLPGLVALVARRAGLETVCVFLVVGSVVLLVLQEAVAGTASASPTPVGTAEGPWGHL